MSGVLGGLAATLIAAVLVGMLVNANGALLFAVAPGLYPAQVRTTAVGWALAAGRIGAIVAPLVAGLLVDEGWSASGLFALFSIPLVVAAVAIAVVARMERPTERMRPLVGQLPPAASA